MSKKAIIVFLKNPVLGKVKTRLAKTLGDTEALSIYQKLANHTISEVKKTKVDAFYYYSENVDNIFNHPAKSSVKVQVPGDLGLRMMKAFEGLFQKGYQQLIIIGSDCPGISSDLLNDAFKHLSIVDVVIGPARDGGYYLLGMNELHPNLFQNKKWSTPSVFDDTLKDIRALSLNYAQLETLNDIDTEQDLILSGFG